MMLALLGCVNMPDPTVQSNSAEPKYAEVYRYAYMALQEGKWLTYKRLMRTVIDKSTASGAPPEKRAIYWYEGTQGQALPFASTISQESESILGRAMPSALPSVIGMAIGNRLRASQ